MEEVGESLPCSTTAVSDTMYVARVCVDRALSTGNADCICGVLHGIAAQLGDGLFERLRAQAAAALHQAGALELGPAARRLASMRTGAAQAQARAARLSLAAAGRALLASPVRAAADEFARAAQVGGSESPSMGGGGGRGGEGVGVGSPTLVRSRSG